MDAKIFFYSTCISNNFRQLREISIFWGGDMLSVLYSLEECSKSHLNFSTY